MSDLVKYTLRFALFLLLQVFVLHQVPPLHQFITPYLYFLYILWLPFKLKRVPLLLISFGFGLVLDWFLKTPGLHAAPCLLIAYLRPFLINILIPQEGLENNYAEPSPISMGWVPYFTYVIILTLLHHSYLVLLEWMQFGNFIYFLGKVAACTAISLLLIILTELLVTRKQRYRTNMA